MSADESPSLTRITVSLNKNSKDALDLLTAFSGGMSKTDIVNRALQLLNFLEGARASGNEVLLRDSAGEIERVTWL